MTRRDDLRKTAQEISPGARMRICYRPISGPRQGQDVELPFKILAMGNFKGHREQVPLGKREAINITPETFNEVMAAANITITLPGHPQRTLHIRSLDDFHPDHLIQQLPDLQRYLRIKERLSQLKSRLLTPQQRRVIIQALQRDLNELIEIELPARDEKKPGKSSKHDDTNPS